MKNKFSLNGFDSNCNSNQCCDSKDYNSSTDLNCNNLLYGSDSYENNKTYHTKLFNPNTKPTISYGTNQPNEQDNISVSSIIGSFGWFQLLVLIFSGLREASVGYDAVVMSIILQPESNFTCADDVRSDLVAVAPSGNSSSTSSSLFEVFKESPQCFQSLNGQMLVDQADDFYHQLVKCESWLFEPNLSNNGRVSMVADWSLVCHKSWLVPFIESAYFFGLVTGNLVWGYYADKVGRRKAYLTAHTMALIFGWASVMVPSVQLFALCRFLSAFGSIGYNIIYSIQVELIGTKYRAFSTTLNHLGWGLGVISVPLMNHLFSNYRYIIAVAPVLTLLMFPWALLLPESSRWLMANGEYGRARQELIRAAKFNGKQVSPLLEKKISLLGQKIDDDKRRQEISTDKHSYRLLFSSPKLVRDTILLSYASFAGHLFYYMLTINFAYMKNLSVEANFITSGAGEWASVIIGAVLLKVLSRKTCMSFFLFLMAGSFAFQSLIDSGVAKSLDNPIIITTNNGIGTLSGLLLVFVTLIVNQEVYPTVIRQTGSSIVNTLGETGSTLAPMLIQLARSMGLWKADLCYSLFCMIAVVAVQFITKTDDVELTDT